MSTPRFHVPQPLIEGARLALPEAAAHHAARVLRLRVGDAVTLFNGAGGEYAAHIADLGKHTVPVEVGRHTPVERESPLAVTLVQAISSGEAHGPHDPETRQARCHAHRAGRSRKWSAH